MPETEESVQPIMRGRFSLYQTPDGGFHIAFRLEGEDEDRHQEIPGTLVKLARMGGRNPFDMLKGVAGGKR